MLVQKGKNSSVISDEQAGIDNALFYKNYTGQSTLNGQNGDGELQKLISEKLNQRYAGKNKKGGHV